MKRHKISIMKSDGGADGDVSTPILDDDVVQKILSKLPVKSLVRFKCVCKSWQSLIQSDKHFADLHFTQSRSRPILLIRQSQWPSGDDLQWRRGETNFYALDFSEYRTDGDAVYMMTLPWAKIKYMLKPVNGLICFVDSDHSEQGVGAVLIFNLSTREKTPWINTRIEEEEHKVISNLSFGFGFDPVKKEHKVICMWVKSRGSKTTSPIDPNDQICEVLTVGQNSWRRIAEVPPYNVHGDTFYANGSIYWVAKGYLGGTSKSIVAFDVGSEKFRVIPIPYPCPCPPFPHGFGPKLVEVNGGLALLYILVDAEKKITFQLWTYDDNKEEKKKNTTSNRWIEEPIEPISLSNNLNREFIYSVEAIPGTSLMVLLQNCGTSDPTGRFIFYYDRKMKTLTAHLGDTSAICKPKAGIAFSINNCSVFVESLFHVQ